MERICSEISQYCMEGKGIDPRASKRTNCTSFPKKVLVYLSFHTSSIRKKIGFLPPHSLFQPLPLTLLTLDKQRRNVQTFRKESECFVSEVEHGHMLNNVFRN